MVSASLVPSRTHLFQLRRNIISEKPSALLIGLIMMSLARFEFEFRIVLFCFVFLLSLVRSENRVCLSRDVQEAGVAWRAATRTVAGVGDLMQRTGDGHTGRVLGGRAIERSGGVVCDLHRARGN
jgi:hypothetical protein